MKKRLLPALSCAILCAASCMGINANAASYTNDGLTAEIAAENTYNEADGTAEVWLKVTNFNDFDVENVSIEGIIPEGIVLVDTEETSGKIDSLAAGETMKLSVKVAKVREESEETTEAPDTDKENSEDTTNDASEDSEATTQAKTTSTKKAVTTAQKVDSPKTGSSDVAITIVFVVAMIALGLFMFSSKKRAARMLSLMLAILLCGDVVGRIKVAADDGRSSFAVTENIYFDKEPYTIRLEITYDTISYDINATYTRGEWMLAAAKIAEITSESITIDPEDHDWFYGDTYDTEDGLLFEQLYLLGVVPDPDNEGYEDPEQDIALFEADKLVTREYAAYTAVKLLGFYDSPDAPDCADADSLRYPAAVSTALKFNMFSTIDGNFNPDDTISQYEYNQVIAVMKSLQRSRYISKDEAVHSVVLKEGVISDEFKDIEDFTVTDNGDDTYTAVIPAGLADVEEGSIIVLPATDGFISGVSLKVTSVTENGDELIVEGIIPEMEEVISSINLRDTFQPDPANFIPCEGFNAIIGDSSENSGDAAPYDVELFDINKQFEPNAPIILSGSIKELDFEIAFKVPAISVVYKTHESIVDGDWDYVTDEALFCLTTNAAMTYSYTLAELNGPKGFEKYATGQMYINATNHSVQLGCLPIPLPAGFEAELFLYGRVTLSGKLLLYWSYDATIGYQYINGEARNLNEFHPHNNFNFEVIGEFRLGLGIEFGIGWTALKNLIGFDLICGPAVTCGVALHGYPELLVCANAKVYFFMEIGLYEESTFAKLLSKTPFKLSLRQEIFNQYNSPWKKVLHIEKRDLNDVKIVPDCTWGVGNLVIHVTDADGQNIKQTRIKLYNKDGERFKTVFTDSSGKAEIRGLGIGEVEYEIAATGYEKYTNREYIRTNQTTYSEAVLLINRDEEKEETDLGTGINTASGTVKNAINGQLMDAEFEVRKGANAKSTKPVIKEGETTDGKYSVDLPVGYYTLTFKCEEFLDSSINIIVRSSKKTTKDVVLSPVLQTADTNAEMRIVLTWGRYPEDLDSHLLSTSSSDYHIYFDHMNVYRDGDKVANLDVDDTSSYGPETTTIYAFDDGEKLCYYVHDYTDRDSTTSDRMSLSDARVVVYSGSDIVGVFNTPISVEGNLWHVFDYDPSTGEITAVNTYSSLSSYGYRDYFIDAA